MTDIPLETIKDSLKNVIDPTYEKNIFELDHIKDISIKENSIAIEIIVNTCSY